MKKLLFLINYLPVCLLFMTCNTPPASNESIHNDKKQDSLPPAGSSSDSTIKSVIINAQPAQLIDTVYRRIEHGSNNQEKLDSIKNAKAREKKKK